MSRRLFNSTQLPYQMFKKFILSLGSKFSKKAPTAMDATTMRALQRIQEAKKTSHPWKRQVPFEQPYYTFSEQDNQWRKVKAPSTTDSPMFTDEVFTVLSWNIDFMLPLAEARMTAALNHLQVMHSKVKGPCIIFLQEMLSSDLDLISRQTWIQASFNLTDVSTEYWESGYYGTCTLVPKVLPIKSVFRVHYEATDMERDALFVDIAMRDQKALRFCNTHLESLVANPPKRPKQLQTASTYMHDTQVQASILGGDLNAIQDFDETLHEDNNLQDAYLSTGGERGAENGQTWGQMARTSLREQFGLSRMDRLLYCGNVRADRFATFGLGIEVDNEDDKSRLMQEGLEAGWVTDHLGVSAEFRLQGSARLS